MADRRSQDNVLIGASGSNIGKLFSLDRINHQVISTGMQSNNHTFIYILVGLDEQAAAGLQVKQREGRALARYHRHQNPVGATCQFPGNHFPIMRKSTGHDSGTGIMTSTFSHYGEMVAGELASRTNGVLVSMVSGKSTAFSLFNLQARGRLFIEPNQNIYEGMVVGLHSRGNDLVVNPVKGKQLTNIRAAGSDENIILTPPVRHSLEQALEFIDEDELVEVTPLQIRIRKKLLTENERKRAGRERQEVA